MANVCKVNRQNIVLRQNVSKIDERKGQVLEMKKEKKSNLKWAKGMV